MTAKLFKLQFREVWRVIRILIPLTFLFILVTSAAALLRIGLLTGLLMTVTVIMIIGSAFVLLALVVMNDYQNMQGRRAYFVRSIPAAPGSLFSSRFLYYLSFLLIGIAALAAEIITLVVLMNLAEGNDGWSMVRAFFGGLAELFPMPGLVFLAYSAVLLVLNILSFMFAISVGSEAKFRHLGIGGPVVVYIIYYIAMQVTVFVSMFLIPIGLQFNPAATALSQADFRIVRESMIPQFVEMIRTGIEPERVIIGLGIIPMLFIVIAVITVLTYRSMDRKLTLN